MLSALAAPRQSIHANAITTPAATAPAMMLSPLMYVERFCFVKYNVGEQRDRCQLNACVVPVPERIAAVQYDDRATS
jgi:hypothetical protein